MKLCIPPPRLSQASKNMRLLWLGIKMKWYVSSLLLDFYHHHGIVQLFIFKMYSIVRAPCGFSRRFEDGSFSMQTKMKICSNLHWWMKMWRTQISGLLKNEDNQLPHLLKMKIPFLTLLKTEDLKTPLKMRRKWRPCRVQGVPLYDYQVPALISVLIYFIVILR